jgi:hypothetical protein
MIRPLLRPSKMVGVDVSRLPGRPFPRSLLLIHPTVSSSSPSPQRNVTTCVRSSPQTRRARSATVYETSARPDMERRVQYRFTPYFERRVLRKRRYLTHEMCVRVVESPIARQWQPDGQRVRFWASVPELGGRYLRVITLADERTIHNAFPDRRFTP